MPLMKVCTTRVTSPYRVDGFKMPEIKLAKCIQTFDNIMQNIQDLHLYVYKQCLKQSTKSNYFSC